ncbi:putative outer membrane protein precursor [compost metagenome]
MRIFPNASAFYAQKINDDLFAGIGMYGNYGLGTDYGNWAGDRLIKKSTMAALTLSPSVAYKLNDRLSIGGSVNLNYGFLSLTRNVDGDDETEKDHDWAMSYRLGLLMELTDQTRAGIT